MEPWTREDTQSYIKALESRLEDIGYYLEKTTAWCEDQDIDDERVAFMCCFLTCVWVSQLRGESISYIELMELMGADEVEDLEEKMFELNEEYLKLEHEELLQRVVKTIGEDGLGF